MKLSNWMVISKGPGDLSGNGLSIWFKRLLRSLSIIIWLMLCGFHFAFGETVIPYWLLMSLLLCVFYFSLIVNFPILENDAGRAFFCLLNSLWIDLFIYLFWVLSGIPASLHFGNIFPCFLKLSSRKIFPFDTAFLLSKC